MSGLILKLAPKERLLINRAVIENGERRSKLNILSPNTKILRLRDAVHPSEATTPVRRACYIVQLMLSGEVSRDESLAELVEKIEELSQVFLDLDSRKILDLTTQALLDGREYLALKELKKLIPRESRLLAVR